MKGSGYNYNVSTPQKKRKIINHTGDKTKTMIHSQKKKIPNTHKSRMFVSRNLQRARTSSTSTSGGSATNSIISPFSSPPMSTTTQQRRINSNNSKKRMNVNDILSSPNLLVGKRTRFFSPHSAQSKNKVKKEEDKHYSSSSSSRKKIQIAIFVSPDEKQHHQQASSLSLLDTISAILFHGPAYFSKDREKRDKKHMNNFDQIAHNNINNNNNDSVETCISILSNMKNICDMKTSKSNYKFHNPNKSIDKLTSQLNLLSEEISVVKDTRDTDIFNTTSSSSASIKTICNQISNISNSLHWNNDLSKDSTKQQQQRRLRNCKYIFVLLPLSKLLDYGFIQDCRDNTTKGKKESGIDAVDNKKCIKALSTHLLDQPAGGIQLMFLPILHHQQQRNCDYGFHKTYKNMIPSMLYFPTTMTSNTNDGDRVSSPTDCSSLWLYPSISPDEIQNVLSSYYNKSLGCNELPSNNVSLSNAYHSIRFGNIPADDLSFFSSSESTIPSTPLSISCHQFQIKRQDQYLSLSEAQVSSLTFSKFVLFSNHPYVLQTTITTMLMMTERKDHHRRKKENEEETPEEKNHGSFILRSKTLSLVYQDNSATKNTINAPTLHELLQELRFTQKGILFRKSKPNENNISNEQDNKDNIENYYLFLPLSPHLGILRTIYDSKELSSILSEMNSEKEEKHSHHHEGAPYAEHHQLTRINKNYSFGLPLYLPTTTLDTSDNKDCESNCHSTKKTGLCRMEYFDLNIFKLLSFFSIDSNSNNSSNYDEIAVSTMDSKHLEEGHKMSTDSSKMDDIDSKKNNEDSKPAKTEEQVNCEYHQSIEQIYENCICKNNPTPFDFVTNHIFGKKRSEVKVGGDATKTQERDDLFLKKLNTFLKSTDDISIIHQNNTISSSDSSSFTKETTKEYQEKQLRLIQIQIFLRMQLYVIRGLFVLSAPKEHLSSSPTKINKSAMTRKNSATDNIHPNDNLHFSTSTSNSVLDQFVQKQFLKKKKKQKKKIRNQCQSISSSTTTTLMNNKDDFSSEDFVDYIASFLSLARMLFYQSSSSSGQTQSTNSKEEKENFPEQQQSQHTVSQQEKKRSTTNITNTTNTTTRATSTTFESYFEETIIQPYQNSIPLIVKQICDLFDISFESDYLEEREAAPTNVLPLQKKRNSTNTAATRKKRKSQSFAFLSKLNDNDGNNSMTQLDKEKQSLRHTDANNEKKQKRSPLPPPPLPQDILNRSNGNNGGNIQMSLKKKANSRNPLLAGGKGRYKGSHFSNNLSNMKKLFRSSRVVKKKTVVTKHTNNTSAARLNNQRLVRRSASVSSDASTKKISSNKFSISSSLSSLFNSRNNKNLPTTSTTTSTDTVTRNNNAFMAPVRKTSSSQALENDNNKNKRKRKENDLGDESNTQMSSSIANSVKSARSLVASALRSTRKRQRQQQQQK